MGFSLPCGFRLAGVSCGIKRNRDCPDLTLIVGDEPLVAAGVYTTNLICAAPVVVDRQRTPSDAIRVVVANSGNANACTGERGLRDALDMAGDAARACGAATEQALVLSTGIIGEYLPMEKIRQGIAQAATRLGCDEASFVNAARGITTTDRQHKVAAREVACEGSVLRIAGMAKGAGMIGPKMATLLAVLMTDAPLAPAEAQEVLEEAVDASFNCISVEGHMSTNDTVLLLASGKACQRPLSARHRAMFQQTLSDTCIELARLIPDDGEGASHLITIDVSGCATPDDARRIAETIANSALVKTAIAGADPNWGRIVSAAGYAGVPFDPNRLSLFLNQRPLFRNGQPVPFDAQDVSDAIQNNRETHIDLRLEMGDSRIRFWTSDLTADYVKLNADYHT